MICWPKRRGCVMLWEVEIRPRLQDVQRQRVCAEYDLLTGSRNATAPIVATARGYLLEGDLPHEQAQQLADELLVDPLVETARLRELGRAEAEPALTVLLKPGVMDPAAQSVLAAAADLGMRLETVRTFRRYFVEGGKVQIGGALHDVLANDAIEQIIEGPLAAEHVSLGTPYDFRLITVPLRDLDDSALLKVSRDGQLSLDLAEMHAIQAHFRTL